MNFNKKIRTTLLSLMVFGIASCEKPSETPPRSDAFIREYVVPEPTLLSAEEREQIRLEREEYENL